MPVNRVRWIVVGGVGAALITVAAGEHLYRRIIQQRYVEAVRSRQQLQGRLDGIAAQHEQTKAQLAKDAQGALGGLKKSFGQ